MCDRRKHKNQYLNLFDDTLNSYEGIKLKQQFDIFDIFEKCVTSQKEMIKKQNKEHVALKNFIVELKEFVTNVIHFWFIYFYYFYFFIFYFNFYYFLFYFYFYFFIFILFIFFNCFNFYFLFFIFYYPIFFFPTILFYFLFFIFFILCLFFFQLF